MLHLSLPRDTDMGPGACHDLVDVNYRRPFTKITAHASLTDWVCFLVLDIGTPEIQSLPVGTRISAGFLQSAAVRAAGFAIVPVAALAPAVK
jgi:hypothetical protein